MIAFGRTLERSSGQLHGRVELYIEPRDLWIGAFVAADAVYVCLLPCCVIRISRGRKG